MKQRAARGAEGHIFYQGEVSFGISEYFSGAAVGVFCIVKVDCNKLLIYCRTEGRLRYSKTDETFENRSGIESRLIRVNRVDEKLLPMSLFLVRLNLLLQKKHIVG